MDTIANYIPVDLHCHSIHSDGAHSISELLNLVHANGGKYLALTDHDTVDGIAEAKQYAQKLNLHIISGVEISVTWDKNNVIHILGFNINENDESLKTNLNILRSYRLARGIKIANKLAQIGIPNALAGALKYCTNENALSRTHFMKFLINQGYAKPGQVFHKYLGYGKPGYVAQQWASLSDAINWINASGGVAVIAHPLRYKFTHTKLLRLIEQFKEYGGRGIEVTSSGICNPDLILLAKQNNLLASVGSDFHDAALTYNLQSVGKNPALPDDCPSIFPLLNINLS